MTLWIEDAKMENFDEKYDVGERSLVMIKAASMVTAVLSGLLLLALRGPMGISQGKQDHRMPRRRARSRRGSLCTRMVKRSWAKS